MAENTDKKNTDEITDLQEEFDYQKEIEEIERQEKELAERRARKQQELQARREERARREKAGAKESRKEESRREKQKRELQKESEWLGEPLDEEEVMPGTMAAAETRQPARKKSHKGLAAAAIILMLAAAGGGAFAFKSQADKKAVSDFQAKVSAFQTEKLDGAVLGSEADYFDDFIKQCQEAIDAGDLSRISELNGQWAEVEKKLGEAESGKASLDAFVKAANDTLAKYESTDDTKSQYEKFRKALEQAQKNNEYDKIEALQKDLASLETALKAADIKKVQEMKNKVSELELDKNYVSEKQQKELDTYAKQVEDAQEQEDYAGAIDALNQWQEAASEIASAAGSQKKAAAATAASEAAAYQAQVASNQRQQAAAEAAARAIAESRQQAASSGSSSGSSSSSSSSGKNSYSSLTSDYVFSDSSSRYLAKSELKGLSTVQLLVARNEIYARHGWKFQDKGLRDYFNGKSWYKGTVDPDDFSVSVFNKYEKANIMLIKEYEDSL